MSVETEVRDEAKKLLIDLIRSDPEVHAALKAGENGDVRRFALQIGQETQAEIQKILERKYTI